MPDKHTFTSIQRALEAPADVHVLHLWNEAIPAAFWERAAEFVTLRQLTLSDCRSLTALPPAIGALPALEHLRLERLLQLGLWCEMTAEECAYHHPLFGVGHYDGGNYLLVLDMSDADPADPRVYAHDHDAYDTFDPTHDFGIRLSEFLSRLEPED
jgi:hypothetical protein